MTLTMIKWNKLLKQFIWCLKSNMLLFWKRQLMKCKEMPLNCIKMKLNNHTCTNGITCRWPDILNSFVYFCRSTHQHNISELASVLWRGKWFQFHRQYCTNVAVSGVFFHIYFIFTLKLNSHPTASSDSRFSFKLLNWSYQLCAIHCLHGIQMRCIHFTVLLGNYLQCTEILKLTHILHAWCEQINKLCHLFLYWIVIFYLKRIRSRNAC